MKFALPFFIFMLGMVALSAQSNAGKPDLTVFPNPATEFISVQDNYDQVSEVVVINLAGKRVKVFNFVKGEQYYIGDLPKNIYLVQLVDKHKQSITTQKLQKR